MKTTFRGAMRHAPALVLALLTITASAQDTGQAAARPAYQTFFLSHAAQQNEAIEIVSVLRNELSHARINYVSVDNAVSMEGTPDELAAATKIIADLDRAVPTWRLTYTITQSDGSQPQASPQRVSMIVTPGSHTQLKVGNKVPLVTGSNNSEPGPSSQVQYIDVGLNIDAGIEGASDTPLLKTKIEQSRVADERSGIGTQDPMIHQTVLENAVNIGEGKPMVIGTLDLPGSTRQEKVEVTAERVKE